MDTNDLLGNPHEVEEHDALEHFLVLAAKALAVAGGAIFCALVLVTKLMNFQASSLWAEWAFIAIW